MNCYIFISVLYIYTTTINILDHTIFSFFTHITCDKKSKMHAR